MFFISFFSHRIIVQAIIKKGGFFVTEKLKIMILKNLEQNLKGYIFIAGVFAAGVILSCVLNISAGSEEEIKLYITDFISNIKNYSTDSLKTFSIAINGHIRFISIIFLMSITVIGNIGIYLYVFLKGFSYGAVLIALFNMMGIKTILFFFCAIFPHLVILLPCFSAYMQFCIKNSQLISKNTKNIKTSVLMPFLSGIICIMLASVAALIQAYLEPLLIRLINI